MRCLTLAATILFVAPASQAGVIHLADQEPLVGPLERGSLPSKIRVRTLDGVQEVRRADALRIETDEDLRRTLESTIERLGPENPLAMLRSAQWALRKGLFEEALDLADRASALNPELTIDTAAYLPLPVIDIDAAAKVSPKDAWRLLNVGADPSRPVSGAVAVARLSSLAVEQDVDKALEKALRAKSEALRSSAMRVIRAATPAKLWPEAMRLALFDPAPEIRDLATQAAAAYEDPRMVGALQRALVKGNAPVREAAMDAIETLQEERTLGALVLMLRRRAEDSPPQAYVHQGEQITFVSDFDVDVANSAFIANPNIGVLQPGGVLESSVLATSARRFPAAHRRRAAAILSRFTQQDFGTDPDAWDRWLKSKNSGQ